MAFSVAILIVLFGLSLAFFSQSTVFHILFNNQIDPAFWNHQPAPDNVLEFQKWIYGVLGATVAGWGVFLAFLARYPFKSRQRWTWNCIALGLTLWFLVDTAVSAFYRVYFNTLFNLVLFLVGMLPLVFTYRDMNS
jgi:hypothetical protein